MSGGNTNHAVRTHTQKNAKLQLLPGPLPPRFVMCQDSGPAEVIESERGGGVGGRGGRGAQLEKQQRRLRGREPAVLGVAAASVWRGDSARPPQGKPAAAGAARPRLTSAPVPRRCVFHVSGATSGPAPQPKHPSRCGAKTNNNKTTNKKNVLAKSLSRKQHDEPAVCSLLLKNKPLRFSFMLKSASSDIHTWKEANHAKV